MLGFRACDFVVRGRMLPDWLPREGHEEGADCDAPVARHTSHVTRHTSHIAQPRNATHVTQRRREKVKTRKRILREIAYVTTSDRDLQAVYLKRLI